MNKLMSLLVCMSLIGLGIAPVAQAQNARSSRTTVIREVRPDYRGRSYYNRRPEYRNNSDYYRRSDPRYERGVIIKIDAGDCCDNCSRRYRRGRGETYYPNAYPSRYRSDWQDRSNY